MHAALRWLLRADVDADVAVTRNGLRFVLNPSDFPQHELFWLGTMDTWEVRHARRFLRPGGVFLDVGSNFGYYALRLARDLDGCCTVHAFEPVPATYDRLVRHVVMNGLSCITPHRVGVGAAPGAATFRSCAGNSGANWLAPRAPGAISRGDPSIVEMTTLDRFVAESGLTRVDLVKIDVEGLEEQVLRGAEHVLSRFRPTILIELQPATLRRAGSSVEDVVALLAGSGYQLFVAQRQRLVPLRETWHEASLVNAFCIPDFRAAVSADEAERSAAAAQGGQALAAPPEGKPTAGS